MCSEAPESQEGFSQSNRPHVCVSVVIPVYQNAGSLRETLQRIRDVATGVPSIDLEVCFVDDGSTDDSWRVLTDLKSEFPSDVTLIRLSRNFGQVSAILAGLASAHGDAMVVISADLQDPVDLIPTMIEKWREGSDVVIAHRTERDDDRASRLFSRMAYSVARSAHPEMPEGGFDYMLMSRRAVKLLGSFSSRHRFLQGDILWLGLPTTFLPYARQRRVHGKSTWTFRRKFKYFTDLLLDSSFAPIQFMSRLGFLVSLAGLVYAIVIVVARVANRTPSPGWAPLMVTVLILSGLIMVMLGIIGEYLWRIYDDVKGRPLYIVSAHDQSDQGITLSRSQNAGSDGTGWEIE